MGARLEAKYYLDDGKPELKLAVGVDERENL